MTPARTAAAGAVRRVAAYAIGQGIDEETLRREVGIPVASLEVPDRRVSAERLFRLWAYLAERLHDTALPIRVAEQARLEDLHVLGFAIMSAPTLADAVATLVRFCPLLTTSGSWQMRSGARSVEVSWRRGNPSSLGRRLSNETAVAQFVGGLRRLGGADVHPLRVAFRHPKPASVAAHRAFFGCPVEFGAASDAITLPRDVLEGAPPCANPGLWAYLCKDAEARARALAPRPAIDVVYDGVVAELARAEGAPSLAAVAYALGTSERSLRRRLQGEGTTFRALVDRARRERAIELLGAVGVSVGQAALLAGFSDASALTHASRRWFGCTPRELRARLHADGRATSS